MNEYIMRQSMDAVQLADDAIWLALDTSTASLSAAVLKGNQLLAEVNQSANRTHSVHLVPALENVLKDAELDGVTGIKLTDVQAIATGQGPGSYTGVRIGVTVAKTLAWLWKVPVVGVSSLEGMAYSRCKGLDSGSDSVREWVLPIMNARRGQCYTSLFVTNGGKWDRLVEDDIRMVETWFDDVVEMSSKTQDKPTRIVIIGEIDWLEAPLSHLREQLDCEVLAVAGTVLASDIGRLAVQPHYLSQQLSGHDVHLLTPNYTQLPEAERKLLAKSGR